MKLVGSVIYKNVQGYVYLNEDDGLYFFKNPFTESIGIIDEMMLVQAIIEPTNKNAGTNHYDHMEETQVCVKYFNLDKNLKIALYGMGATKEEAKKECEEIYEHLKSGGSFK